MRILAATLVVVFLSAGRGDCAETAADPRPAAAFQSLCLAVREPEHALGLLSARARAYYEALFSAAKRVDALPNAPERTFEERAIVRALREYAPASVLSAPTSAEALKRALALQDERLLSDSAALLTLERVTVDGDKAVGSIVYDRQLTPFLVHYVRTAGVWKIERILLSPTFVSVLTILGIEPEAAVVNVRDGVTLWQSLAGRTQ